MKDSHSITVLVDRRELRQVRCVNAATVPQSPMVIE